LATLGAELVLGTDVIEVRTSLSALLDGFMTDAMTNADDHGPDLQVWLNGKNSRLDFQALSPRSAARQP
jgi:hypothetical protein